MSASGDSPLLPPLSPESELASVHGSDPAAGSPLRSPGGAADESLSPESSLAEPAGAAHELGDSDESELGAAGAQQALLQRAGARGPRGGRGRGRGGCRGGSRRGTGRGPAPGGGRGNGDEGLDEAGSLVRLDRPAQNSSEIQNWFRLDSGSWQLELLSHFSGSAHKEGIQQGINRMTHLLFGPHLRQSCGLGVEAALCNISREKYPAIAKAFCALNFFVFLLACEAFCKGLYSEIQGGVVTALCGFVFVSNDETSMYMNMPSDVSPELLAHFKAVESQYRNERYTRYLCKIMNIVVKAAFLIKRAGAEEPVTLLLDLPEHLYNMDHNTTETTRECWCRIRRNFPWLFKLLGLFPKNVLLVVNDNGIQNIRWFGAELRDSPDAWANLRSNCDVHAAHNSFGAALDTQKAIISGITNTSLAMSGSMALNKLRDAIRILGKARIRVTKCEVLPTLSAAAMKFRVTVVQCFLRPAYHGISALIRAFILVGMLQGDWRSGEYIDHFCLPGCCTDDFPFSTKFDTFVTDSLAPCLCPTFRRGRWMGCLGAVDWQGLIFNVHQIGHLVVGPWSRELGNSDKPVTQEDFKREDAAGGMAGAFAAVDLPQLVEEETFAVAMAEVDAAVAAEGGSEADLNKVHRMQAASFAALKPGPWFILIRTCMIPFLTLMQALLAMAGAKFDRKALGEVKAGKPMKYRMLEMANGVYTNPFFTQCSNAILGNWFWERLPLGWRTETMASAGFKFLVRGAAATFWLVHFPRTRRFPSILFRLLEPGADVADIIHAPSCTFDDFTKTFRQWFPTEADMVSPIAILILTVVAVLMRNETVQIEDLHALLRRHIVKSVQCRKRSWTQILAEYVSLRLRARLKGVFDGVEHAKLCSTQVKRIRPSVRKTTLSMTKRAIQQRELRKRKTAAKKNRKRRSVVSAWNVFQTQRWGASSLKWTKHMFKLMAEDFGKLSPTDSSALKREAMLQTTRKRAQQFLNTHQGTKRQRLRLAEVRHEDSLVPRHRSEYEEAALFLTNASILDASTTIAQARTRASQVADRRRRQQARTIDELNDWKKDVPKEHLKGSLSKLSSSAFLRGMFAKPSVAFAPNIVPLAKHLFERLPKAIRESTVLPQWKEFCAMVTHSECDPIGNLPVSYSQKWCYVAARCLCQTGPDPYLRRIQESFSQRLRKVCPAKDRMRTLLSAGDCIVKILSSDFSGPRWLHISYINLTTFIPVVLALGLVADDAAQSSAKPCVMLTLWDATLTFRTVWDAFDTLSPLADHFFEFWRIQSTSEVERPSIRVCVLRAQQVLEQVQFWNGPRLCAGGPPPVGPDGPSGDAPALRPPGPRAPALLAIEDVCVVEADVPDVLPGVDAIVEAAHLALPDPIIEADEVEPDEKLGGPEPLADGDAGDDGGPGKGAGDKGKGKGKGDDAAGPAKVPTLRSVVKTWAAPTDRSAHADSDPVFDFATGQHRGRIQRWKDGNGLVFMCAACDGIWRRSFKPRKHDNPDRFAQGRPMGFLIGLGQHPCGGDNRTHRMACEGMSFELRSSCRREACARSLFSKSFELERDPWTHEGPEPVAAPWG